MKKFMANAGISPEAVPHRGAIKKYKGYKQRIIKKENCQPEKQSFSGDAEQKIR
jgi:hypothetical protein